MAKSVREYANEFRDLVQGIDPVITNPQHRTILALKKLMRNYQSGGTFLGINLGNRNHMEEASKIIKYIGDLNWMDMVKSPGKHFARISEIVSEAINKAGFNNRGDFASMSRFLEQANIIQLSEASISKLYPQGKKQPAAPQNVKTKPLLGFVLSAVAFPYQETSSSPRHDGHNRRFSLKDFLENHEHHDHNPTYDDGPNISVASDAGGMGADDGPAWGSFSYGDDGGGGGDGD